ncbi:Unknown protein [Striga hermonthica]|uniref:Vacuolar ATPase assembly protein VMA22 n=1 Tax=Striga hermonthica TaxID=68872 RepID=A0A9N7P0G5_STRHE|nr:Unknown protein [Striga hermonthica]
MHSSNNTTVSTNELVESEQHILNFLDSMDSYLTLMDSLSSSLRQGWLDLASARQSMGALRVSSVLFDLKSHHASTTLQVHNGDPNMELPHFTLSKWASSDDPEKHSEKAKFEDDEFLQNKSNDSPREQNHDTPQSPKPLERRDSGGSPITPDNQAQRERFKSLSMFGTLVSPKLRATQLSFETALEMLIEIANMRASLLCAYNQVLHDQKTAK